MLRFTLRLDQITPFINSFHYTSYTVYAGNVSSSDHFHLPETTSLGCVRLLYNLFRR